MPSPHGEDFLFQQSLEKFKEWYEVIDTLHGKNMVMIHDWSQSNLYLYLLKLKDKYRHRMIRAGYSYDPTGFNRKTMGTLLDVNRAFVGYESPLKEQMKDKMRE